MPPAFIPVNMQFLSGFWLAKRALKSGASHLPFYDRLLLFNIWFVCSNTVYPKKYAHGFCFAVFCCGYTLTDFPISIRLNSLALWQSNDCPSANKATLMNMDKYFMWIHYERLHNHNKAKHNKTVCIFLGIYCMSRPQSITKWCCKNVISVCLCHTLDWKGTKHETEKFYFAKGNFCIGICNFVEYYMNDNCNSVCEFLVIYFTHWGLMTQYSDIDLGRHRLT